MTTGNLYNQASEKLDEYLFDDAVDLFRKASLVTAPSVRQLANLGVAEAEAMIDHRRRICTQYSDLVYCKINFTQCLYAAGKMAAAVKAATEVLDRLIDSPRDAMVVRSLRFKSSLAGNIHDHLISDFEFLWQINRDIHLRSFFRRGLILDIAGCNITGVTEVIRRIVLMSFLPESVVCLLKGKVAELEAISKLEQTDWA